MRESSIAVHPRRHEIDRALLSHPVAQVAATFDVSPAALYRWQRNNLGPRIRDQLREIEQSDTPTFIDRLAEIANDLRATRRTLLEAGAVSSAATAAVAEVKTINALLDRLGIDSEWTVNLLRADRAFRRAAIRVWLKNPEFGQAMVHELHGIAEQETDTHAVAVELADGITAALAENEKREIGAAS